MRELTLAEMMDALENRVIGRIHTVKDYIFMELKKADGEFEWVWCKVP